MRAETPVLPAHLPRIGRGADYRATIGSRLPEKPRSSLIMANRALEESAKFHGMPFSAISQASTLPRRQASRGPSKRSKSVQGSGGPGGEEEGRTVWKHPTKPGVLCRFPPKEIDRRISLESVTAGVLRGGGDRHVATSSFPFHRYDAVQAI